MITDSNYYDYFSYIFKFYCQNINDVSDFNFDDIYICSKMCDGLADLNISYTGEYPLGATILPIGSLDRMIILIEVTNNYDYEDARRLIHELTHAYHFIKYAKFYNDGKIINFRNHPLFSTYEDFSEFCAFGIDEIYAFKLSDNILNTNKLDIQMIDQNNLMKNYILSKRNQLLSQPFTSYDLMQVLGKIFSFDKYNQICDLSKSIIYKYIPMLFHTHKFHTLIYKLYEICYLSIINDSVFENLTEIDLLLTLLCQSY